MDLGNIVIILHLMGMAVGFGGAVFLDVILLKFFVYEKINHDKYQIVKLASSLIVVGLMMLWVTGLILIYLYFQTEDPRFSSEKLWAKVTIVGFVSINGLIIHDYVLKIIQRNSGDYLFSHGSKKDWSVMVLVAAVSSASWLSAFILGAANSLPHDTSAALILLSYFGLCFLFAGVIYILTIKYHSHISTLFSGASATRSRYYIWETKSKRHKIESNHLD